MTSSNLSTKRFFLNKRFFLHVKNRANTEKAAEFIRLFGGQIDQFLETSVSYVLTDVPKNEWPPNGHDDTLKKARANSVKLMSYNDLVAWCSKYISSQSSSDEDDETKANITELREPFIKFEDINCHYSPTVREFIKWPEININALTPGKSIFSDPSSLTTPNQSANHINHPNNSAQITQQAISLKTTNQNLNTSVSTNTANHQPAPLANSNIINGMGVVSPQINSLHKGAIQINHNLAQRGVRRKHGVYCEICNQKINEKIEEHIQTQQHRSNSEKTNWSEVISVIDSLPSLSTLNMRRLSNFTLSNEHPEFVCLHKMDSVSQLFVHSNKDFNSMSPIVDRKLVHIQ